MLTIGIADSEDFLEMQELLTKNFSGSLKEKIQLIKVDRKDNSSYPELTHLVSGRYNAIDQKRFPHLTDIYVPFTGLNGLDLDILSRLGVSVHNTSAHAPFIAERALALLLSLQGKIILYHEKLKKGNWLRENGDYSEKWDTITNKKIAIYGYGHIGQHLHHYLKAFHCQVGILNYKDRRFTETLPFNSLTDLAQWCDSFIITAPLTKITKGSVNTDIFQHLNGKTLINVGRGPIIDEDDLYKALYDGSLGGFASDVWFQYPNEEYPQILPSKYPLEEFENVIMTPHSGGGEKSSSRLRRLDILTQILEANDIK